MNRPSLFGQIAIFVLVIIIMNGILYLFGAPWRFSIIGSLVGSFIFTGLVNLFYRRD